MPSQSSSFPNRAPLKALGWNARPCSVSVAQPMPLVTPLKAIVSDAGGNHAVNLSDLESFLTKMNGELTRLRQANAPNRGSGRGGFGYHGARGRGSFVGRGRATGGGNNDQARQRVPTRPCDRTRKAATATVGTGFLVGARAVQEHSNQKCRHSSAATSASTAVAGVASLAAVNSDVTGKKAEEGRKESMGAQWNQRLDGRM